MTMAEFLPGLPIELIRAAYQAAPGNEMGSGKFDSPESSSALVANSFGFFLDRPGDLPQIVALNSSYWSPSLVRLEGIVRFPWSGGRHPCLDVLINAGVHLIGVESKRYEPFRPKAAVILSDAYWRPVWGDKMAGYQRVRDKLRAGTLRFRHLDAAQLVKHAFGLRSSASHRALAEPLVPSLVYLYAEPSKWPDGRMIRNGDRETHAVEVEQFASLVDGDEVKFASMSYKQLLEQWDASPSIDVRAHSLAVRNNYDV